MMRILISDCTPQKSEVRDLVQNVFQNSQKFLHSYIYYICIYIYPIITEFQKIGFNRISQSSAEISKYLISQNLSQFEETLLL